MVEGRRHHGNLTREEGAHFMYPVLHRVTSDPLLTRIPSWRLRHAMNNKVLEVEMMEPSDTTRQYWEEHDLPQPRSVTGQAKYLLTSAFQDFGRIATSADRRLRVARVRKKNRPEIVRRSHELLKVARMNLDDLVARTDHNIPVLWLTTAVIKPDAVIFGLRGALPLRGTVYDAETGSVRLSDNYRKWLRDYQEVARKAGTVVGCPAPHIVVNRADGRKANLLGLAWESYVDGIYAGKPRN